MKYNGLILDLDNTLYRIGNAGDIAIEKTARYFKELVNIDEAEFIKAFYKSGIDLKYKIGSQAACHNRLIYFKKTIEYFGLNPFLYALDLNNFHCNAFMNEIILSDGVYRILQKFKNNKGKICILTDMMTDVQLIKIKKLGLENLIDIMFTSEEIGAEKPNPLGFYTCIDYLNLPKNEILFIGDNYERDIIGAEICGLESIYIDIDDSKKHKNSVRNFEEVEAFIFANFFK